MTKDFFGSKMIYVASKCLLTWLQMILALKKDFILFRQIPRFGPQFGRGAMATEMEVKLVRDENQDFLILKLQNATKIFFQSKHDLRKLRRDFGGRCVDRSKNIFRVCRLLGWPFGCILRRI